MPGLIGQIPKFDQLPHIDKAGDPRITLRDTQGVGKESFASSAVSISNQQGKESIRRIDRVTFALWELGNKIKNVVSSLVKIMPGPDAFYAVKDARELSQKVYQSSIKELKGKREGILNEIAELQELNETEKTNLRLHFDAFLKTAENIPSDLVYDIVQYQDMKQSASTKRNELIAGGLHAAGLTAGAAWAATAVASKTTSLVAEQVPSIAAQGAGSTTAVAGSVLNLVAAGILIPVQLALISRNVAHINTSRHRMQHIAANKAGLDALKNINSDRRSSQHNNDVRKDISKGINAAQEMLERRKTYSKYEIAGSTTSMVGDIATLVSAILTLTGVGAIIGIPVSIFGFIISITGTILRSVTQGKENRFIGKAASESARIKMASNANRKGVNGAEKPIQDAARLMNDYQVRVAENKLHSIIHQVIKDAAKGKVETEDGVLTEKAFLQEVERRADNLINRLKKTSLLDSDLQEMKTLMQNKYLPALLPIAKTDSQKEKAIDLDALQNKLYLRLEENMRDKDMELKVSAETEEKINKAMTKELFLRRHGYGNADIRVAFMDGGKKKAMLTKGDIETLRVKYPHVQVIYERVASKYLMAQITTDTRALRNHFTELFINLAHAEVIDEKHSQLKTTAF